MSSEAGVPGKPHIAPELSGLPHVPVNALGPLQGELKTLSKREYNKLKKSLLEHGIIVPFFVWQESGKLLDGHQRQRVMLQEGWLMDVPVVYISAVDEQDAKRKLLVISSQYGRVNQEGWDAFTFDLDDGWLQDTVHFDALPFVFGEWGDEDEPAASADAEPQVNRAEELREEWGTEPGQLWRLPSRDGAGYHLLICGDCTDPAVVERVMGGGEARMLHADPPYGIGQDIENDNLKGTAWLDFHKQWTNAALPFCVPNAYVYVWGYFETLSDYWQEVVKPRGDCNSRNFIIWKKSYIQGQKVADFRQFPEHYAACLLFIYGQPFQNGPWSTSPNAEYYPEMFEPIRAYLDGERQKVGWDIRATKKIVGHGEYSADHWFGRSQWSLPTRQVYEALQAAANGRAFLRQYDELRGQYDELRGHFDNTYGFTDLWEFDRLTTVPEHPTVKPVEVVERAIMSTSKPGEIVLEPFVGSGTTIIAAENLSRQARAVEISPAYVAVALDRYWRAFGIRPELIQ